MFWSPLLDANISTETRGLYRAALVEFVEFADAWDGGDAIERPMRIWIIGWLSMPTKLT